MSKFIGKLADIGIAIEGTRGTLETSADFWLPKMSLSFDDEIEQVVDESSVGVIEDATDAKITKKIGVGEVEGKIGADSFGTILKATLGTLGVSGPTETTVYTHTATVQQDAQHDSLTIMVNDPNQDYSYALGMITSLALDVSLGEFAKFTLGFRSKKGATASHTPSYSAEDNFLPQHGEVKIAAAQSGLTGATALTIRNISLSIEKNVEDDHNLGSLDPTDILNKQFAVEGSLELVFDDETFKTQMLADTAQALRIDLINTDVTIGSTLNPKMTIDLYKVKFSEFKRGYDNTEVSTATVNFKAFYSLGDSKMLDIVLINETASY